MTMQILPPGDPLRREVQETLARVLNPRGAAVAYPDGTVHLIMGDEAHCPLTLAGARVDILAPRAADEAAERDGIRGVADFVRAGACDFVDSIVEHDDGLALRVRVVAMREPAPRRAVVHWEDASLRLHSTGATGDERRRLRAIIDNSFDLIAVLDPAGRFAVANRACERALGRTERELLGAAILDFVESEDRGGCVRLLDRLRGGGRARERLVLRAADGTHLQVEGNFVPVLVDGRIAEIHAFLRDITEFVVARDAREALEKRLARARRSASFGMWEWDYATRTVWWSPETWALFGVEENSIPLTTDFFYSLVHPDDLDSVRREIYSVPAVKSAFSVQYRIRLASGETRVILEHGGLEVDADGTPLRITGTVQDVTERAKAEEVVAEFAALGRRMTTAASLRDASMAILESADRLIGWDAGWLKLVNGSDIAVVFAMDTTENGRVEDFPSPGTEPPEAYFARVVPDGPRLIHRDAEGNPDLGLQRYGDRSRLSRSLMLVPLRAAEGTIGVVSIQSYRAGAYDDASLRTFDALADQCAGALERLVAENRLRDLNRDLETRVEMRTAELRRANAELERATRLKDEFLSSMSHELRTPLNAILGLSEALREGVYGTVGEKQAKSLQRIEESGRTLLELVNQVLDLSKIEAGRLDVAMEEFDVAETVRQSMRFVLTDARKKGLAVEQEVDPGIGKAWGDPRRIRQALVNLLSNAVKFTPPGGVMGIRVEADAEARELRFVVHDNGVGIPADKLGQLFRPFVQLDAGLSRQHGGSGLGLALVKRLAELHEGRVSVQSEPGRGSRFSIHLPWDPAARGESLRTAKPRDEVTPRSAPALLPAKSGTTVRTLATLLARRGLRIESSRTGGDIFRISGGSRPAVLVLDAVNPAEAMSRLFARVGKSASLAGVPAIYVGPSGSIDNSTLAELRILDPEGEPESRLEAMLDDVLAEGGGDHALFISSAPSRPVRVLLAEDNEIVRTSLSEYLAAKGCDVLPARDGEEAVRLALEARPDIVFMDVQMPVIDGLEATRRMRADRRLCDVPIIALTALAMPGDKERCLQAGANDYLSKPVSLRRLCEIVSQHGNAETHVSGE